MTLPIPASEHGRYLRALARLLGYPDAELMAHLPQLRGALSSAPPTFQPDNAAVCTLLDWLQAEDLYDAQAHYVECFDRGRATCLNLFEHVHGESRDRGQAMVDLLATYQARGFTVSAQELPDHLSIALEFASLLPEDEARGFLAEMAHIVAAIALALQQRASPYAAVLQAVLEFSGQADAAKGGATFSRERPGADTMDIDADWQEPEPFSAPFAAPCARPATAAGAPQPVHFTPRSSSA